MPTILWVILLITCLAIIANFIYWSFISPLDKDADIMDLDDDLDWGDKS